MCSPRNQHCPDSSVCAKYSYWKNVRETSKTHGSVVNAYVRSYTGRGGIRDTSTATGTVGCGRRKYKSFLLRFTGRGASTVGSRDGNGVRAYGISALTTVTSAAAAAARESIGRAGDEKYEVNRRTRSRRVPSGCPSSISSSQAPDVDDGDDDDGATPRVFILYGRSNLKTVAADSLKYNTYGMHTGQ